MNKKGQALVEFILILPILIFILLAIVDIGKLNIIPSFVVNFLKKARKPSYYKGLMAF